MLLMLRIYYTPVGQVFDLMPRFYATSVYHWAINAPGERFECDEPGGGGHATTHHIWVREGEPSDVVDLTVGTAEHPGLDCTDILE